MTAMNWDRVNRENRAIREANRTFAPEGPIRDPLARPRKRNGAGGSGTSRRTEKDRALAWHRANRACQLRVMGGQP